MNIKNCCDVENIVMKEIYCPFEEMEYDALENKLTDQQKQSFFNGLNWATSLMTAQEAYVYYMNK